MEKEIVITMRKDDLRSLRYDDEALWEWCKSKKIKVEEPRDIKTKLFETLVITLKTPEQKLLFSCRWFGALEKLSNVPSNCNKPQVSNNEAVNNINKHKKKIYTDSDFRTEKGENKSGVVVCRHCGSDDVSFNWDAGLYICDNCNKKELQH
jgi:hypothetical protein